jgi:hypothetical protein
MIDQAFVEKAQEALAKNAALPMEARKQQNAAQREDTIQIMMSAYPIEKFPRYTRDYVEKLYDSQFPT